MINKLTIKNLIFGLIIVAVIATAGFLLWQKGILEIGISIGLGIFAYGLAYFIVHDIFIHQRFKFIRHLENDYFKAIRRAHKIHHKNIGKEQGECFGMLWVPIKYFKNSKSNNAE